MTISADVFEQLSSELAPTLLLDKLTQMVTIESVNPFEGEPGPGYQEQEFAEYYLDQMNDLGLEVNSHTVVPGRPNVWGRLRGTGGGPTLLLAGHLDTVGVNGYERPFEAKIAHGRLYGRGSCDMKAGLAAYLEVVRLLKHSALTLAGDMVIAGIADEEHRMIGSKYFGRKGPRADFGIIGEPTELAICPAHKGQLSLFIRTFGKAVHSSMPELGENAIERMAKVIMAFADYNAELKTQPAHTLCGHGRFSPGVIRGGDIVSAVPDFCELEVDRRTLPGESQDQIIAEFKAKLDALVLQDPHFRYELSGPSLNTAPLDISPDIPLVRTIAAGYETVLQRKPTIKAFPGGTDAPNLGIPTVICGPGSLAQAHTLCEYVEIDQLVAATRIYLKTALDLLV